MVTGGSGVNGLIRKPKNSLVPTFSPDFTRNRQIRLFYAEKWIFFLIKEEKKEAQPELSLRPTQPKLLDQSILFSLIKLFLQCEYPFIDKAITEPAVSSAQLIGLSLKLLYQYMSCILHKDLTPFRTSLSGVCKNRASKRKALLAGTCIDPLFPSLSNTVAPPCATTFHKWPPPISNRLSKTPKFSRNKALNLKPLTSKRPFPVSSRDHF